MEKPVNNNHLAGWLIFWQGAGWQFIFLAECATQAQSKENTFGTRIKE
jgi:hypothetical protein